MEAEHYYAKDRQAWRKWLAKNHTTKKAVWLVYDKGAARKLSYDDIVEEALCFGWVDSRPGKVDDKQSKLYISVRNPTSVWAKTNKARIIDLTARGLMQPAGIESVRIAKINGSWDLLNQSDNLEIPPEMKQLFATDPVAKANYEAFSDSSKRIILEWIYSAKRQETRMNRINQAVEQAHQNIKANHYRQ